MFTRRSFKGRRFFVEFLRGKRYILRMKNKTTMRRKTSPEIKNSSVVSGTSRTDGEAKKYTRPSWDQYFMSIAQLVGSRGTCDRGRSGCVIARDKQILVTGYVGSPIGFEHCDDIGHEMTKFIDDNGNETNHCSRTVHAEQNAITQAAKLGIAIKGGTLYCQMTPCYACAKMIINCGIIKVLAFNDYHKSHKTKEAFTKSGVVLEVMNNVVQKYSNQ